MRWERSETRNDWRENGERRKQKMQLKSKSWKVCLIFILSFLIIPVLLKMLAVMPGQGRVAKFFHFLLPSLEYLCYAPFLCITSINCKKNLETAFILQQGVMHCLYFADASHTTVIYCLTLNCQKLLVSIPCTHTAKISFFNRKIYIYICLIPTPHNHLLGTPLFPNYGP